MTFTSRIWNSIKKIIQLLKRNSFRCKCISKFPDDILNHEFILLTNCKLAREVLEKFVKNNVLKSKMVVYIIYFSFSYWIFFFWVSNSLQDYLTIIFFQGQSIVYTFDSWKWRRRRGRNNQSFSSLSDMNCKNLFKLSKIFLHVSNITRGVFEEILTQTYSIEFVHNDKNKILFSKALFQRVLALKIGD